MFGKFFAWELFVVIEHLWYCALNHRKFIPQGVATKRNNFLRKTGKPKKLGGNEKKTKKNQYFTKIEPYLYEFVANESSFGIYTRKKDILFEI